MTVLHKITLGLIDKDIEQELSASTATIDAVDIIGRTSLSMAAEMSDLDTVTTLLRHGADPNLGSFCLQTPMHYAASAKKPECLKLLLQSGADVDCLTNWDQTPLHLAAAYTGDRRHATILLEAGADPNRRDRDGISPLAWTAISNNFEVASCLLNYGADVEDRDFRGSSTLKQCIKSNRHEILTIILPLKPRVQSCIAEHDSFWELVAEHADLQTIALLRQLDMTDLDLGQVLEPNDSVYNTLRARADNSPELEAALEGLVEATRALQDNTSEVDDEVWEDALENLAS